MVSGALSRDQILKANDIRKEKLYVPEWGGDVWVKGLTGKERDAMEAGLVSLGSNGRKVTQTYKLENLRARLCAMALCDERGQRLFSEADIPALGAKSAAALERVYVLAMDLSALSAGDLDALTEDLKKDQPDASLSA